MPVVDEGGSVQPIVSYKSVAVTPSGSPGGGVVATVVNQSGTVEEAVAAASVQVKQITVGQPSVGNLPKNATPGQMFSFASNPATIYVFGADFVWRALLLVTVS